MSGTMIVTGGSRGIGAAIARLAGRRGYDVCVNYTKSKDQAEQVVRDIEASGQRALAVLGDIGNETELTSLYEVVDRELGPLTALIKVGDGDLLRRDCEEISNELREQYTLGFVAPDPLRPGYRSVRVDVPGRSELTTRVRRSVTVGPIATSKVKVNL